MRAVASPRRSGAILALCCAVLALLQGVVRTQTAHAAEIVPAPASGSWTIDGHGLGHGHGLSQYGAQGAAIAGLNYGQILDFYYQHTVLVTGSAATMRVLLTGPSNAVTVVYKAGLVLRWGGGSYAIPAGASQWRLIPAGTGLSLQRLVGTTWSSVRTGLPVQADFGGGATPVRYLRSDTLSIDYRGTVGAVRSGAGLLPINRVSLDDYTRGVVPREMPALWQAEALKAQAVAARSYGRYAWEHKQAATYDICDTSQCQVYGGAAQFVNGTANGVHEEAGSNAAVTATASRVLTYAGGTIFAQFSAADGGWTVAGGQPYLLARADPYEQRAGGSYFAWTRTATVSTLASRYGLARVSQIQITGRDGNGEWGGRVTTAIVQGVYPNGSAASISTTGVTLAAALGLPHHWFKIRSAPPSQPTSVTFTAADHSVLVRWSPPISTGSATITGYSIAVYGQTTRVIVPATARSYWVNGLTNDRSYSVYVWAISAAGEGPRVGSAVIPHASADLVSAVTPLRLFDTRNGGVPLTPASPMIFSVPGHGSITSAAKSVMLALTIVNPSMNGILRVYPDGAPASATTAIAYRAGVVTTATVAVSLVPTKRVAFVPSAGSLNLIADQSAISADTGQLLTTLRPPAVLASATPVATGAGQAFTVRGVGGVPAGASAVLLQVVGRATSGRPWLRLWPDGAPEPIVSQVSISATGSNANLVLVPLSAAGAIRIKSLAAGVSADLTVVGYLAPAGSAASGAAAGHFVTLMPGRLTTTPVSVSSTPIAVPAQGRGGIPNAAASGVLVQVTVSGASAAGTLRLYANGTPTPATPSLRFTPGTATSATALVAVGSGGTMLLATDGATATVTVEAIGYATGS